MDELGEFFLLLFVVAGIFEEHIFRIVVYFCMGFILIGLYVLLNKPI